MLQGASHYALVNVVLVEEAVDKGAVYDGLVGAQDVEELGLQIHRLETIILLIKLVLSDKLLVLSQLSVD